MELRPRRAVGGGCVVVACSADRAPWCRGQPACHGVALSTWVNGWAWRADRWRWFVTGVSCRPARALASRRTRVSRRVVRRRTSTRRRSLCPAAPPCPAIRRRPLRRTPTNPWDTELSALSGEYSGLRKFWKGNRTLRTRDRLPLRHFANVQVGPKCPDISAPVPKDTSDLSTAPWSELSRHMDRSVPACGPKSHPNFVVYVACSRTTLSQPRMPCAIVY